MDTPHVLDQPITLAPAGHDLPGEAARLRALGPLIRVTLPGGIPAWYPTRHDVLEQIILHPEVGKDPRRHWRDWPKVAENPEWSWLLGWIGEQNMFTASGSDHARLRKLIAPSFTARRTKAMRPIVERITAELLDALEKAPAGEPVDLRTAYAHPLPMRVICELIGLPEEMRPDFARLIENVVDTTVTPEQALANYAELQTALEDLIACKRRHPADDLTTEVINARDQEDRLTDDELRGTLLLVIGGGHETTVNLISNAIHALLTHPDHLAAVIDGCITWPAVIEATLRWAPSIANLPLRFTLAPLTFAGVTIPKGEAILTTYLAANHDPARHGADACRFNPARERGSGHLSFGIGVHRCLGAELARMEAGIALPALFERFPAIRLATDIKPTDQVPSFLVQGWQRLPVHLHASSAASE